MEPCPSVEHFMPVNYDVESSVPSLVKNVKDNYYSNITLMLHRYQNFFQNITTPVYIK